MQYNTQRSPLKIAEYGRVIQNMVENALQMNDREQRTKYAYTIIHFMQLANPQVKETADYKEKLWDHLFYISDYQLDVDAPYEILTPEKKQAPQRLSYPTNAIKYKSYGKAIEKLVVHTISIEDEAEKEIALANVANLMKRFYLTWNQEAVNDSLIFQHIQEISDGQLKLDDDFKLKSKQEVLKNSHPQRHQNHKHSKKEFHRYGKYPKKY